MTCIATKEKVKDLSDSQLHILLSGQCDRCAVIARKVLVDRRSKEIEEFLINERSKEMSKKGFWKRSSDQKHKEQLNKRGCKDTDKNKKTPSYNFFRTTPNNLSFLISDKSGKRAEFVVKDIDNERLHGILQNILHGVVQDILDGADEIVIRKGRVG